MPEPHFTAAIEPSPYATTESTTLPTDFPPYPEVKGFRVRHAEELMNRPPLRYLVEGLIPERGVVLMFAPPKAKKSFVAQDICYHIATGRPWAGRAVLQGCPVYAAGERTGSLGERLKAWIDVHEPDGRVGIKYLEKVPDLMKGASVDAFIGAVRYIQDPISLLVLDTLARCTVGSEENMSRDMQVAMSSAERIGDELRCAVLIIHHSNRAGTGERGSGALRAAVDVVLQVEAVGKDRVIVRLDASNDLPQSDAINFEVVPAGASCALRYIGTAPSSSNEGAKVVSCLPTLLLIAQLSRQSLDGRVERRALGPHVAQGTLTRHLKEATDLGLLDQDAQKRHGLTEPGRALVTENEVSLAA